MPLDPRYALRTRPCIPVHSPAGPRLVGLRELFINAHELTGLAVTLPPAAAGLTRILCAIAARLTALDQPDNARVWSRKRASLLSRPTGFDVHAVDEYLERHGERLFLFDPRRPFLQDPRLLTESPTTSGVNKLVMSRPAGNNPVFIGHFTDAEPVALPPEDALLHLIAQLYYGPSGQCTPRIVDGQRFGNTMGGPLRRSISFHPEGGTLYETLLLGIPAPGVWRGAVGDHGEADACPWEREELPDPLGAPQLPTGPLSLLTEQYQHAVLLRPDEAGESVTDATITWALRSKRPEGPKDPYLIWDEGKDGTVRPRDASSERALWRDLDALVMVHRNDPPGRRPPIVDGLTGGLLPAEVFSRLRITAHGFDQDGQTRDRSCFTAATPPVLHHLLAAADAGGDDEDDASEADTLLAEAARDARLAAERSASRLRFALRVAWRNYTTPFRDDKPPKQQKDTPGGGTQVKGEGPWPADALARFWPAAERSFWQALHTGEFPSPRREFGQLALDAYDEVTRQVASAPRGAKAREEARGLLLALFKNPGAST